MASRLRLLAVLVTAATTVLVPWAAAPALAAVTGTASPSSLSFPTTVVGATSVSQVVSFSLSGATPSTALTASMLGDGGSSYSIVTNGCTTTDGAGQVNGCQVEVAFAPVARGLQSGWLELAAGSSSVSVALTGTAVGPTADTSTPTFASLKVGQVGSPQTVTLANNGDPGQALSVSSVLVTGSSPGDFVNTGGTCGQTFSLAVGESCTVLVAFHPTAIGTRQAVLRFAASAGPHDVTLSGSATPPDAVVSLAASHPGTIVDTHNYLTLQATTQHALPGTVEFFEGETSLGPTQPVANDTASWQVDAGFETPGDHTFTALFTPDSSAYAPSTSAPLVVHYVRSPTMLSTIWSTVTYGTGYSVDVTVHNTTAVTASYGPYDFYGWVTLTYGSVVLDTEKVTSYQVTLKVPAEDATLVPAGSRDLTVTFTSGNPVLDDSFRTDSVPVAKATATAAASWPSKVVYGTGWSLPVKVSAPGTVPTGSVTLLQGSTTLATGTLTGGAVTLSVGGTKLVPGSRALTLRYNGSANVATATLGRTETVVRASSTTTDKLVSTSVTASHHGTLTVTVAAKGVVPTGTISLYDGTTRIGTYTLSSANAGKLTITLPLLSRRTHYLHTTYGGSTYVAPSTGSTVVLTVT